ncbi:MAG: peptidoglycan DD-metalloendopeptidase family protein [Oscillospiraceae bacterium]|jgi:murein DD-endopeptidase MepM/ murein hydrolase activator NlpD|nr:peptidoglycan DD-metalloendopeptidase family protein [Oscillospiraceae bacterium]
MMDNRDKRPKFGKRSIKGKGFYIALAVCLTCIGAAAFTTFQSIKEFSNIERDLSTENKIPEKFQGSAKKNLVPKTEKDQNDSKQTDTQPTKVKEAPKKEDSESANAVPAKQSDAKKSTAGDEDVAYPLSGKEVSKSFSSDKPVFSETFGDWRTHDGTDFKAEQNEKVKSVANGKVTKVLDDDMSGGVIEMEHKGKDAIITTYRGVKNKMVELGQNVKLGQEIGEVGKFPSESDDETHLHIEMKRGSKFIDPMEILKKAS